MPSVGPNSPNAASTAANGAGSKGFTNVVNAFGINAANDSRTCQCSNTGPWNSDFLIGTDFGFAIPANATVTNITGTVRCKANTSCTLNKVQLQFGGGLLGGSAQTASVTLSTAYIDVPFNWGTYSPTPSTVNNSTFGLAAAWTTSSGSIVTLDVDYYSLTITYTVPNNFFATLTGQPGTITGSMTRAVHRQLDGSYSPSGNVTKRTTRPLSGTTGALSGLMVVGHNLVKVLAGSLSGLSGSVSTMRVFVKILAGAVGSLSGSLTTFIKHPLPVNLSGSLGSLSGSLATRFVPPFRYFFGTALRHANPMRAVRYLKSKTHVEVND